MGSTLRNTFRPGQLRIKQNPKRKEEQGHGFRGRKPVPHVLKNMIQVVRAAGAQMTQSQSYSWIPREKEAEPHQLGGTAILLGFLT